MLAQARCRSSSAMRPTTLYSQHPNFQNYIDSDNFALAQQKQHQDEGHDSHFCRSSWEQDAAFQTPGNSAAAYYDYPVDNDDDEDADVEDNYSNDAYRQYNAEAVMTPAPVDGDDEDSEYLPDNYPLDGDSTSHPSHHEYLDHQMQGDDDVNMSDSDGGVSLRATSMSANVSSTDLDYDSDDPFPPREEDGDGDDEDETDDDDGGDYPNIPAGMYNHVGTGGVPSFTSDPDSWVVTAAFDPTLAGPAPHFFQPPTAAPGEMPPINNVFDPLPPVQISNPNPSILGSENLTLVSFLRHWAYGYGLHRPDIRQVMKQAGAHIERIHYSDLAGDGCDLQGLDWEAMCTTRDAARQMRRFSYKNYVNRPGSDCRNDMTEMDIPSTDTFVRFKKMNIRRDVSLAHFQLRSVLACPSRAQAFYPSLQGINVLNTASGKVEQAMNLRGFPGMAAHSVSTLDAGCGVLMAGTFSGDYCLQALGTEDSKTYSEGQISNDISGITNHIRIHRPRRTGSPVAAIASNDHGFRIMDIETEKFISHFVYPFALNCSAISPDGRLRAVVGDNLDVLITNAETGEVLQKLGGHHDYGFSCDWSENGYTVATGFQDKAIKIWDARRWCNSNGISTPLCTIRAEMAGVRSLRFSPLGTGKPILVAAEEADFINIIDAETFCSKQTFDVFGEIGGVAFANRGQDLNVLCCDTHRGGLLQFERCSLGRNKPHRRPWQQTHMTYDWSNDVENKSRRQLPPYMDGPELF